MFSDFLCVIREDIGHKRISEILAMRSQREMKKDGSYVTQGDLLAQKIIRDHAGNHFDDLLIVSEEINNPTLCPEADTVTIVLDPIDGTENFTSGLPEWGISVSCYLGGVHRCSLIGCPEIGHWLMTGDTITRYRSRIRGLSSSLSREEILEATQGYEYRISGCCVYNMMSVIRGSFQSFENPKGVWSWDILGGLNLALEHGLNVELENKPYAGEYLTPDRRYRFKVENR
jgi:fructose-1,6-bisphosphatase/inositol monophosphatase family enzyme